MTWHPAWCDPQHCYVTDDGVRAHQTAPICYEDGLSQFELQLFCPEDEFVTYLLLLIKDLCLGPRVCAFAPLATVAWLRDQLFEHLDATVRSNGGRPGHGCASPDPTAGHQLRPDPLPAGPSTPTGWAVGTEQTW